MGKVTSLDRQIADNIKHLREKAKLTQPQVADHLGIAYQSYQKMERGGVSFRASTLSALADLYITSIEDIVAGETLTEDPRRVRIWAILSKMDDDELDRGVEALLRAKHGVA